MGSNRVMRWGSEEHSRQREGQPGSPRKAELRVRDSQGCHGAQMTQGTQQEQELCILKMEPPAQEGHLCLAKLQPGEGAGRAPSGRGACQEAPSAVRRAVREGATRALGGQGLLGQGKGEREGSRVSGPCSEWRVSSC